MRLSYIDPFFKNAGQLIFHNLSNKHHFPLVFYESKVHLLEIVMSQ